MSSFRRNWKSRARELLSGASERDPQWKRPADISPFVPRDHWLEEWEKDAIIDFHRRFPLEGHRRFTFMMLDRDIVAVGPSSTYRLLKGARRLFACNRSLGTAREHD